MTSSRKLRLAPALAATTVVALAAALTSAPAGASPEPAAARGAATEAAGARTFLSYNIAAGRKDRAGQPSVVSDVIASMRSRNATGAVLNEVCPRQARELGRRLPAYRVHFFRAQEQGCGVGNAVIAPRGSTRMSAFSRDLPSNQRFGRSVGCVRVYPNAKVALCGTHLQHGHAAALRDRQARVVGNIARRLRSAGFATVVGGDFNAVPQAREMRHLYSRAYPGGVGVLRESTAGNARRGRATVPGGAKIDYLFHVGFDRLGNDVVRTQRSDHFKVWVRLRRS